MLAGFIDIDILDIYEKWQAIQKGMNFFFLKNIILKTYNFKKL